MYNQNKQINNKKSLLIVFGIVVAFFVLVFSFFSGYFSSEKNKDVILIDTDNTEIVVEKKDLKEIESRLGELDIDLDDILNELEF
jgi:uncharacterized membrane protein YvbJ